MPLSEQTMGKYFKNVNEAQSLCEALAAPARTEIMRLVLSHRADSLDALAKTLHLSNGAITQHVKKLCDAGLIRLVETAGRHGVAKRCVPAVDRIIIEVAADLSDANVELHEIALGAFTSAAINPYCAIATADGWIGERDDPRYFTYPERAAAALIYFNSGKIGWTLPAPPAKSKPKSVSVSLELSSKPYGFGQSRSSRRRRVRRPPRAFYAVGVRPRLSIRQVQNGQDRPRGFVVRRDPDRRSLRDRHKDRPPYFFAFDG